MREPANPNPSRENKHTLYLAATGGGKSQVLKQNKAIPKSGARVILFDPALDHPAKTRYSNRAEFARGLAKAVKAGRGFRIAYSGIRSPEIFEWFCKCVWAVLDGNKETYLICEELHRVCPSSGKAGEYHSLLLNEGRKYGLIYHGTSQRPQEIPKTAFDNVHYMYVGQQKNNNIRKMADLIGVNQDDIRNLDPLEFYLDDGTANIPPKITVKYKK